MPPPECITVEKSNIYYVVNRVDVRWGDISQIETELILFEKACTTNRYDYYHLLSGVDLPIKSQNYIHDFFSEYADNEYDNVDIEASRTKTRCYMDCSTHY